MMSVIDTANRWASAHAAGVERAILRLVRKGFALDELEHRTFLGRPGHSEIWARGARQESVDSY